MLDVQNLINVGGRNVSLVDGDLAEELVVGRFFSKNIEDLVDGDLTVFEQQLADKRPLGAAGFDGVGDVADGRPSCAESDDRRFDGLIYVFVVGKGIHSSVSMQAANRLYGSRRVGTHARWSQNLNIGCEPSDESVAWCISVRSTRLTDGQM